MSRVGLVTGITGFIGSALAALGGCWLARHWNGPPPGRRHSYDSGETRDPGAWRRRVDHRRGRRLRAVPLRPSTRRLAAAGGRSGRGLHCAGDTSFVAHDTSAFARGHISGPVRLLRLLANSARPIRWVHFSTAFVCGARTGTVFEHEDDVGQEFHNTYKRAKLAGELAIRRAARRAGMEFVVLRPAIVIGPAGDTNGAAPSHRLRQFIRLMAHARHDAARRELRVEGTPSAVLNIVPIDYVVRAAAVASHAVPVHQVWHLVADDPPTQQQFLEHLVRIVDIRGVSLVDARAARLADPSRFERVVRCVTSGYADYLGQDVRFDDREARRTLLPWGVRPPRIDECLLRDWVQTAIAGAHPLHGTSAAGRTRAACSAPSPAPSIRG